MKQSHLKLQKREQCTELYNVSLSADLWGKSKKSLFKMYLVLVRWLQMISQHLLVENFGSATTHWRNYPHLQLNSIPVDISLILHIPFISKGSLWHSSSSKYTWFTQDSNWQNTVDFKYLPNPRGSLLSASSRFSCVSRKSSMLCDDLPLLRLTSKSRQTQFDDLIPGKILSGSWRLF